MSTKEDETIPVVQTPEPDDEPVIVSAEDYLNMDEEANQGNIPSNDNPKNDDKSDSNDEEIAQGYSAFTEPVMVPKKNDSSKKKEQYVVGPDYQALDRYDVSKPTPAPAKLRRCNDVFWGSMFTLQIGLILLYLFFVTWSSIVNGRGIPDFLPSILLALAMSIVSFILSTIALTTMMKYAGNFVKTALMTSVITSLIIGLAGFVLGQIVIGFIGFTCFVIGICYSKVVWHRIPYAAANLRTAIKAVRLNWSTIALAYQMQFVAMLFCVFWLTSLEDAAQKNAGIVFLLLVSFYWVYQVFKNVVQVTVAGVIGSWWYVPDNNSGVLSDALCQASTYSFGSICFGSLFTEIIKSIVGAISFFRQNDDCSHMVCFLECTLKCVENIVDYFNKWSYVYVGLYGFSYLDAGRNVLTSFEQKGWTVLVTDDLVDNVLFMFSIGVGLIAGVIGWAVTRLDFDLGVEIGSPSSSGFLVGFLIGFLFTSISMSVVGSAVNTVIVCYVESPTEFSENYPQLFQEMTAAWQEAWPDTL